MFSNISFNEQLITGKINDLGHLSTSEADYSTVQFLQWHVAEQHQEEFLMNYPAASSGVSNFQSFLITLTPQGAGNVPVTGFKGILDKIALIGTDGQGLFCIDREVANLAPQKVRGLQTDEIPVTLEKREQEAPFLLRPSRAGNSPTMLNDTIKATLCDTIEN